jgi:hypothetical protein
MANTPVSLRSAEDIYLAFSGDQLTPLTSYYWFYKKQLRVRKNYYMGVASILPSLTIRQFVSANGILTTKV